MFIPNEAEKQILDLVAQGINGNSSLMKLFKNDFTPNNSTVLGDFTEADFSGYASVSQEFGAAYTSGLYAEIAATTDAVFTHNGGGTPNTIYGFYLVDVTDNKLLCADRLASPITLSALDEYLQISMRLSLHEEGE